MELPKNYYPTHYLGCHPIHAVTDWAYVRRLIRAARRGEQIPPIVIAGEIKSGEMVTGTHRAAANDIMVMLGGEALISVIGVEDLDEETQAIVRGLLESENYDDINGLLDKCS